MRALFLLTLRELRGKYWFIPTIMALAAILLSFGTVALDAYVGAPGSEQVPWLYLNEPAGARALLSTIAGSMITVAGVAFSITIVALATTASTFGPRLISDFMQDRGNQVTLGTFIATFLFCVLVLRTVRSGEEDAAGFVPHLSLLVALLFATASLAVLIYFIHHVPESIHISNVAASLGRRLNSQIEGLFPEPLDEAKERRAADVAATHLEEGAQVRVLTDGYIQYIDTEDLVRQAGKYDIRIKLLRRPGDFVAAHEAVALVCPQTRADCEVSGVILETIVVGGYRSEEQDVLYLIHRLVEVASRALSPGMNDIFTARNAIDWLGSALSNLSRRSMPTMNCFGDSDLHRVVAPSPSFEEVACAVFDQLRPYAAGDRNAAVHLMGTLREVSRTSQSAARRATLLEHAQALRDEALKRIDQPRDREMVDAACAEVARLATAPR